jgi:hypothetical protein
MPRLTNDDKEWLSNNYPGLSVIERPGYTLVEGCFVFNRSFNDIERADSYQIRLELREDVSALPRIYERGGRLDAVLQKYPKLKGEPVELHIYPDKRLCLAAPQELRLRYLKNPSAQLLFEDYIVSYFFSQSFFEENGEWPWHHLPHDSFGVVVWYLDNFTMPGATRETVVALRSLAKRNHPKAQKIIQRAMRHDSFNPRAKCLCGSNKNYIECHKQLIKLAMAFRGIG